MGLMLFYMLNIIKKPASLLRLVIIPVLLKSINEKQKTKKLKN